MDWHCNSHPQLENNNKVALFIVYLLPNCNLFSPKLFITAHAQAVHIAMFPNSLCQLVVADA